MKIAVMQPYIFPYLGYFQLINSVDKFIFYDDVNYIKSGWINRNRILANGKDYLFTIPLKNASSFRTIHDTELNQKLYEIWKGKFLRTLQQSYGKAPFFEKINILIQSIFKNEYSTISELAIAGTEIISKYLEIDTLFEKSSEYYYSTKGLEKAERLFAICKLNQSKTYINPFGGLVLYKKENFLENEIDLFFINNNLKMYNQFTEKFIPGLSIIDVLMFNNKHEIKIMLNDYSLS